MLRNHPGISIFDFDNDCDLDIYVSNTLGQPNSLYVNCLDPEFCIKRDDSEVNGTSHENMGTNLNFVDKAIDLGIDLTDHFSAGSCFGDIDNDGDQDLVVLGMIYTPSGRIFICCFFTYTMRFLLYVNQSSVFYE